MSRAPATFRQSDLTRAVRGAVAAGIRVARIELAAGKCVLVAENGDRQAVTVEASNEWDSVK